MPSHADPPPRRRTSARCCRPAPPLGIRLLTRARLRGFGGPDAEPLPGATVRLVGGGQDIELGPAGAVGCAQTFSGGADELAAGCYTAAVPGGIAPGARYTLEVTLPGGGTITGATTVPEPPALLGPAAGTEIEVRAPGVLDPPAPFVARWRLDTTDGSTFFQDVTGADSATLRTGFVECGEQTPARLDARIVLTVYDANYTAYVDAVDDASAIARARAAAGIQGAAGVFASAAASSVPVMLVRR